MPLINFNGIFYMFHQKEKDMKIEKTSWGEIITIPATTCNSEFEYRIRSVRKINRNNPYEQGLINELEPQEQRARRRLLILAKSMEYFFKNLANGDWREFQKWEEKNKMDWNDFYHGQLRKLEEEVNAYSMIFAMRSQHGWCL